MFIASNVVLASLDSDTEAVRAVGFSTLDQATKDAIRLHDLAVIRDPYVALGCVVALVFVIIAVFVKKDKKEENEEPKAMDSLHRLAANPRYREGVIAQMFYVAAQIMCWTFIIQYADRLGIDKSTAQKYNIVAMSMFLCSRFISTFLMKYVNGSRLLMIFALCAMCTTAGTILIDGMGGLYCLVATSAFMSLMFPTIYGIALEGVDKDKTLGAAFLVMAIVGGALMPPMQGAIIDLGTVAGMPSVNASFILPFICFCIIAIYVFRTIKPIVIPKD